QLLFCKMLIERASAGVKLWTGQDSLARDDPEMWRLELIAAKVRILKHPVIHRQMQRNHRHV
uniref:Uncharacterized protein n=1 Tax=Hucho hucho TaxID=62062 RepID=A0A4W5NK44_9TELE